MQVVSQHAVNNASSFNEAEIRFHIIDPIARSLGYVDSDDTYFILEEKLEYPYVHVGHRSKKDVPLGFVDYRAGVKGARGSFVIEAKAGNVELGTRDIEQAHSYAAHAQVSANYFVLCNGQRFQIFETLSGPSVAPIVDLSIKDLNEQFHQIDNILSPANLVRNCKIEYDKKLKIAANFGSSARIRHGHYLMEQYNYKMLANGEDCTPLIRQSTQLLEDLDRQLDLLKTAFKLSVSGGSVARGEDGRIIAHVDFEGATVHNHAAMTILGITSATFITSDKFLSVDPKNPTIFESLKDYSVSRGTIMPLLFGGSVVMDGDIEGNMFIKVAMHLKDQKILGEYVTLSDQKVRHPNSLPFILEMDISGAFELTLDV